MQRTEMVVREVRVLGLPLLLVLALLVLVGGGCSLFSSSSPGAEPAEKEVCLSLTASSDLNLYDGVAHAVVVKIHPLKDPWGFERSSAQDLLAGKAVEGSLGAPLTVQLLPGETHPIKETFPGATNTLGILADYYRAPGDPEGKRKLLAPAECGSKEAHVLLGPRDLSLK